MKVEGKKESQKDKELTKQPLSNKIQNAVESLLNDRGGGITVQQLTKHLSTTFEVWKEDQIVQEVNKMAKKKQLPIGKGTTERGFKKIRIPFLNRKIRPYKPNHHRRSKTSSE